MELNRQSGILLHITSLYSKYGIGDLGQSAYDFIDFLKEGGQKLWQILPLNPTGYGDSPYQSFSTYATNPLLICPEILVDWGLLQKNDLNFDYNFPNHKVDYAGVIELKNKFNRKAFKNFVKTNDLRIKDNFNIFVKENAHWLNDYSLFIALKFYFIKERKNEIDSKEYRQFVQLNKKFLTKNQINDYYYGAVWQSWPQDIAEAKSNAVSEYREKLKEEIEYYKFLQFIFCKQYSQLKTYANKNGIKIIGDIPIFVALDSSDVWGNKDMFMLDSFGNPTTVAGVPPDYFSETGQLWGNPLFNWEYINKSGYTWWISRVQKALEFCDILRIDHFRGFESYWAVQYGEKTAKKGKWMTGPGKELFYALKNKLGDLPIIAEDLGIITKKVEKLRDDLKLPGMKVLQFGFDAKPENNHLPHNFNTNNMVVYTGTHDNDTTLGWYKKTTEKAQDQFRRYLNVSGDNAPWDMIRLAFLSVANLAIVPIQDILYMDTEHRMNYPGIESNNWQFRLMPDSLNLEYAKRLKYLSEISCRNIETPKKTPKI